ncbi:MAG: hypothetical protein U0835_14475 [Isosphaeraceae bacterium]
MGADQGSRRDGPDHDGAVIFQGVQFLPGPFADPLMGLINLRDGRW